MGPLCGWKCYRIHRTYSSSLITSQHPAIPTLNRMRIVSLLLFVAATCLARHHRFKTHRRLHTVQRDQVELIPVQEEKDTKDDKDENNKSDDKDDDQYDAGRDWYDEEFFREYLAELELYDDKEIGREYPVEKDKSEWYDDDETDYDYKEDNTYSEDIERDYANKEDNQESEWYDDEVIDRENLVEEDILEWYDEENDSEYPVKKDESEWFDGAETDMDNYVEKESESYYESSDKDYPFVKDESDQYDDEKVDRNYHVEKEKLYDVQDKEQFKGEKIHEDNTETSLEKIDDDLTTTEAFFAVKVGETRHHSSSSMILVNVFSSLACLFVTFYM